MMFSLPTGIKIYLATEAVDMRSSHDGLSAKVQNYLQQDVLSGHLFVFFNRKVDRVKILYWERNGYCLWYKRLESGRYRLPKLGGRCSKISSSDLTCLLEGIDLLKKQRLQAL